MPYQENQQIQDSQQIQENQDIQESSQEYVFSDNWAAEVRSPVSGPHVVWWGDQMYDAWMEMLKNETPAERAARLTQEAAQEEKSYNGVVSFSTKKKADKWCTKNGQMKFRVPTPCKYASLFAQRICAGAKCGKKLPEGQTKCSCGEILAGCWSHEKTHSCIYVHPDEDQWEAACSGTLAFDRVQQVFHLKTEPLACPNRFVAVAQQAKEEPKPRSRPSRFGDRVVATEHSYTSTTFVAPKKPSQQPAPQRESAW